MIITYVKPENIKPSEWGTTYILSPDIKLLYQSILNYGWLSPVIVRKDDMSIIDGFARWTIAVDNDDVLVDGKIPVVMVDCDLANSIIMHIRINRGRGSIVAKKLSLALEKLISLGYTDKVQLRTALMMTGDEYDALSEPRLIKSKKLVAHEYSRAWVPIEVPVESVKTSTEMKFERPPTPDE